MVNKVAVAAVVVAGLAGAGYVMMNKQGTAPVPVQDTETATAPAPGQPMGISAADLTTAATGFPTDLPVGAGEIEKATYAWRLFVAAMQQTDASLSSGTGRGTAAAGSTFIGTGKSPLLPNPLVFESFYHRTEAFPYYTGTKPASPIGQVPTYNTFYTLPDGETPQAVTVNANYVYLDETNQIGQNFLYYQNSNDPDFPVLFMAKVNEAETSYALDDARQKPSASISWDFPDQVVEVKSAWRRVSDIKNSDPGKYHQATASYWVADASGVPTLVEETFALIAIHIIQKTANYPEFIFTTFEHVDAVTRDANEAITDPAYKTTYANVAYETPGPTPETATVTGAYAVNAPDQPSASNVQTTYDLPATGAVSTDYTTVVQPKTILNEVDGVNQFIRSLILVADPTNIWANYRLKGVQAGPTSDQTAGNYYLANIVVESSQPGIQLFTGVLLNGGVPQGNNGGYLVNCRGVKSDDISCQYPAAAGVTAPEPTTFMNVSQNIVQNEPVPAPSFQVGGCQGCHGAAQQLGRDFSFLANGVLGAGKELDSVPASALTAEQKAAHNKAMAKSSNSF